MRRFVTVVCLLLMYSLPDLFAQKVQTVSGEYLYYAPENVSPEIARHTAIERARLEALAVAFGTSVSQVNNTAMTNSNGETKLTFMSSGGSEVKGEWLEDTRNPETEITYEQGMLCVRARVWGKAREIIGATIDIDAKVLRNGLDPRFESDDFRDGDDLFFYFRTPVKGFLTVYLVDAEQEAFCLLPYMRDTNGKVEVTNNVEYVFFSPQATDIDRHLVDEYTMTCNRGVEQNELYVIFSPNEFAKANDRQIDMGLPRELSFADFQKWLNRNRMRDRSMTVIRKPIIVRK